MESHLRIRALVASAAFFLLTLLAFPSYALSYNSRNNSLDLRVNSGYLMGESGEYVYDAYGLASGIPGYKVSQLDWKMDSVYMVGLGVTYSPVPRLRFNLDYARNAVDGQGTMDDYDWLYVGLDWSHWSHSPNTTVTEVSNGNISGEFSILHLEDEMTDITLLAGYKRDHFKWEAVGGYGTYSISNYRDTSVVFPDIPVITYEQTFSAPYVGLGLHSTNLGDAIGGLPVVLNATILYSRWVRGQDADTHHLRNLYFTESGQGGVLLAASVNIDFYLSQKLALAFGYSYQDYSKLSASTTVTDLTTGAVDYYPGPAAAMDNTTGMISAQLTYSM